MKIAIKNIPSHNWKHFVYRKHGSNALYLQPVKSITGHEKQVVYEKFHCIMLIGMSGIMYKQKRIPDNKRTNRFMRKLEQFIRELHIARYDRLNKLRVGRHPTNVTSQLTRTYPYSGIVEYEKDVEIPVQMEGKRLILFMERTKPSTLLDRRGQRRHVGTYLCTSLL